MDKIGKVFCCCRVSTSGQSAENQVMELGAAGFDVEPRRVIRETISGSVSASARPLRRRLVDRLEEGDVLVVSRLDRLGRNAIDVRGTFDELAGIGV